MPGSSRLLAVLAPPAAIVLLLTVAAPGGGQDRPSGSTDSCVSAGCHEPIVAGKRLHGPVAQKKCAACHVEVDAAAHRFEIPGDADQLCVTCHSMQERTYAHEPVRQGNCTGCHDPHGSDHAVLLVADPTRGLCLTCHHDHDAATAKFVHGPVATGACILCHEAHSSWQPDLLTEPAHDLCMGCHPEVRADPFVARYRHAPFEDDCLGCHDAHASDHRYNLHDDAPGLCYGCHEPVRAALESAPVVHGALVQESGCLTCHGPHHSALPALQRREEIDLCLECHDRPLATADDRLLTDMSALLAANPDHHGPIRDGACTACHQAHTADEPLLLRLAYPPEFYAPYEKERYALCFECHLPELAASPSPGGVTRFHDGETNLHWLHVNREKGRTCRACHEVHASRNPFHVRDSVPFGDRGWVLEIRFEKTETGGSCAPGCHAAQTYDRGPDSPQSAGLLRSLEGDAR